MLNCKDSLAHESKDIANNIKTTFTALLLLYKTYAYQILSIQKVQANDKHYYHSPLSQILFCPFSWATIWNMYKWQVSTKQDGEFVYRLVNKKRESWQFLIRLWRPDMLLLQHQWPLPTISEAHVALTDLDLLAEVKQT